MVLFLGEGQGFIPCLRVSIMHDPQYVFAGANVTLSMSQGQTQEDNSMGNTQLYDFRYGILSRIRLSGSPLRHRRTKTTNVSSPPLTFQGFGQSSVTILFTPENSDTLAVTSVN